MINLEKEIREQPAQLASIKERVMPVIREVVKEAQNRNVKLVYLAARGTSDHACVYAQYLIQNYVGIPCVLATPSVLTKYNGKLCLKDSLVIGVSQSGAAEDVLAVLERAKKCGALTVGITNTEGSLVATNSEYHIFLGVGLEASIAATKTFTAQLAVMTLLCAEWANSTELFEGFDKLPEAVNELLNTVPEEIESFIADFKDMSGGVVLGRGYNYPIALEGALKVMETNRVCMRGYPMSDFYHGPFAQLTNGGIAFVLASDGVMYEDSKAMIAKLATTPTVTIVISDRDELLEGQKYAIKLPNVGNDALSPYLFAIAMQLFALKLTFQKGIDPDKSTVIKKVTVTK